MSRTQYWAQLAASHLSEADFAKNERSRFSRQTWLLCCAVYLTLLAVFVVVLAIGGLFFGMVVYNTGWPWGAAFLPLFVAAAAGMVYYAYKSWHLPDDGTWS